MLPKLTSLQYLVLHLLFAGRQSGEELRCGLRAMGVRQSRAAFSYMMTRLIDANYVDPQPATRSLDDRTVHHCSYEITDMGVHDWTAAWKFYLNLAPPSADLMPVTTDEAQYGPYDEKTRQAAIRRNVSEHVHRFAAAILGTSVKRSHRSKRTRGAAD